VSICKIAIKAPAGLASGLEKKIVKSGFSLLDVSCRHTAGVYSLPKNHPVPFDRLLTFNAA
jgi:PIN domain nuclease of toxin-antitoxin system